MKNTKSVVIALIALGVILLGVCVFLIVNKSTEPAEVTTVTETQAEQSSEIQNETKTEAESETEKTDDPRTEKYMMYDGVTDVRFEGDTAILTFGDAIIIKLDTRNDKVISTEVLDYELLLDGVWVDSITDEPANWFLFGNDRYFEVYVTEFKGKQRITAWLYRGKYDLDLMPVDDWETGKRIAEYETIFFNLSEKTSEYDPLWPETKNIGDFGITDIGFEDGKIRMELGQMNNGDAIFLMADERYAKNGYGLTVYKDAWSAYGYDFPACG